jgi:hypothetical protein
MRALTIALVIALSATRVYAQDDEPAPTEEQPHKPLLVAPPQPPPDDAPPPEYDAAFAALAHGDRAEARRLLTQVATRGANDRWGARATDLIKRLDGESHGALVPEDLRHESPTREARGEFALFQTIAGVNAGGFLCIALKCNGPVSISLLAAAGGGVGLGLSLFATKGGIHPGHADLINSATVWGVWHGAAILVLAHVSDGQKIGGGILAAEAVGTGAGILLWPVLHPTSGQVAIANTFGIWATLLTVAGHGALDFRYSRDTLFTSLLAVGDVGLIGGALLAKKYPTSRSRMLLIDSGGVLGALAGLGTVVLIEGNKTSGVAVWRSMLPGAIVGLGAAAFLTRHWDGPHIAADVSIVPTGTGAAAFLTGKF